MEGMKDKELKKLKRAELLEIMVAQSHEIDRLKAELEKTKKALKNREIQIENCGSLAEASLAAFQVIDRAQRAADLYLENIKKREKGDAN